MNRRDLLIALGSASIAPIFLRAAQAAARPTPAGPARILTPEKFGATGNGSGHDDAAFDDLLAELHRTGGNATIRCRPGATYVLTSDKLIRVGNVTLDGQGCTFTGGGRWDINGDPGVPGGKPTVANVHFRNFQLKGVGAFKASKGPRFTWVADSTLSDIKKYGATGTYFNFHMSRNCQATRLSGIGTRNGFGFLMYHCDHCTLSDSDFTDDQTEGTHHVAVQVKGGFGNKVQRVKAHDIKGQKVRAMFYCRGDAPWHPAPALGTYPYANGKSWEVPDPDRQTRGAVFEDCVVQNCGSNNAFLFQESSDCTFLRCSSIRSGAFRAISTQNGRERGAHFVDCRSDQSHGDAFNMAGKGADNPIGDLTLENVVVTKPGRDGVSVKFAARPRLTNVQVTDAAAGGLVIDDSDTPDLQRIAITGSRRGGVAISRTRGLPAALRDRIKMSGNADAEIRIAP